MDIVTFLLLALAVYRLAHMVAFEEGPASVFEKIRDLPVKARVKRAAAGGEADPNWIERGLQCPLCISFWLGLLAAAIYLAGWLIYWPAQFIIYGLAISGLAIYVHKK